MHSFRLTSVTYIALCTILLMSGCSSSPNIGIANSGGSVSISKASDTKADIDYSNAAIGSDAGKGAGAGALTGAAWGLTCGPFAIICSPVGALAGAIVGGSAGAIVGATKNLTDEQQNSINEQLTQYLTGKDLEQLLVDTLTQRVTGTLSVTPAPADTTVSIHLQSVAIHSNDDGKLRLYLKALVSIAPDTGASNKKRRQHPFEYFGPESPAKAWIENTDDFIARRIVDGVNTLSDNIAIALTDN